MPDHVKVALVRHFRRLTLLNHLVNGKRRDRHRLQRIADLSHTASQARVVWGLWVTFGSFLVSLLFLHFSQLITIC